MHLSIDFLDQQLAARARARAREERNRERERERERREKREAGCADGLHRSCV